VPECLHHPALANRAVPARRLTGRFCGHFRPLDSLILVSGGVRASWRQFLAPRLRLEKFRSRRSGSGANPGRIRSRTCDFRANIIRDLGRRCGYSGLSPSASNCRLHSVGESRSRSTPMPRGRRPSTAALTRLGARKASEIVMFTWRTLHFSRAQSSAIVVTRPDTTSSSHRRPRAMALTRRARRSNCSGLITLRDALCGSRIRRDLLEGGLCHAIVSDRSSDRSGASSV
jgi:hypothetical protein